MTKERKHRLAHRMNEGMPVVLDTAGAMLLSGSAMMLDQILGVAALGLSVFYINHRIYGRRP